MEQTPGMMTARVSQVAIGDLYRGFAAFVFGYDVFLSYKQSDSLAYATQLRRALTDLGLVCFFDQEETAAGVELKPAIERALKRTRET